MQINVIAEKIIGIIKDAGKIILDAEAAENSVSEKYGSANFVTKYDVAVQNFLIENITKILPDAYFYAEEKENDADIEKLEYCFIIDPIDGTANFINGYRHSSISVALYSFGKALFGAVYNPYQDEMFSATAGGGAFLNGKPIHVSDRPIERSIVAFGTSPYYKDTLSDNTFAILKELFLIANDVRRLGSAALDLAYFAAGRNDIFFECVLQLWDIAAACLIVKEAGGEVTDLNGNPLSVKSSTPVLAVSQRLKPLVLEITKKYAR